MFSYKGSVRSCLRLLFVGVLALPWQAAGAIRSGPSLAAWAPPTDDDLAIEVAIDLHTRSGKAVVPYAIAAEDRDLGPHLWNQPDERFVYHPLSPSPTDRAERPDRTAATCTVSSTSDSGVGGLRQC
ncbi:MAG: hypothetical protein MUQ10_13175, partial [Anaerolineae bacterium]|nr:hypothetical protein [Anaerolineae bacterium]